MKASPILSAREYAIAELIEIVPQTPSRNGAPKVLQGLKAIAGMVLNALAGTNDPRISQTRDRAGNLRWQVYDPLSGQTVHLHSEADVRFWLEQRYSH